MIVVGIGVGFLFALLVLAVSVVSFPLLLDRNVGIGTAISTSVRAVAANPGVMALWGLIVACGLVVGSVPLFVGLVVILPVLGHATGTCIARWCRAGVGEVMSLRAQRSDDDPSRSYLHDGRLCFVADAPRNGTEPIAPSPGLPAGTA